MKICVVDDEREVRISIIQKLCLLFPEEQVFDVGFGRQALEQIALVQPELVFLDIRMPEMDGIEILHELKQANPTICVVIISGYDDFEYARKALQHGATDYLLKPADRVQLREIVEKVRQQLEALFHKELELFLAQSPQARTLLKDIHVYNVSLWLDEREWKKIIIDHDLHQRISNTVPKDIVFSFRIGEEMEGVVIKSATEQGRTSFRKKDSFTSALLTEFQQIKRIRFFKGANPESAIKHFDRNEVGKQAAKLRQLMVQHARAGDFIRLEQSLDDWFGCLEHAGYEELQKECAYLMGMLDEGLSKYEMIYLEEDTLYYWADWVSKHETWHELKEKIRRIVMSGVKALKNLEKQQEQAMSGSVHWFQQALQLIESSTDPNLSLESVAETVNVHPVTLSRMFKQQTGTNFVRYLTRKRMKLAQTMLLQTNKKINEIAEELGYSDYPYFRNLFKKEFGLSPSEFRKSHGVTSD